MLNQSWVRQLRQNYPTVGIVDFARAYEAYCAGDDSLLIELEQKEAEALTMLHHRQFIDEQVRIRIAQNDPRRRQEERKKLVREARDRRREEMAQHRNLPLQVIPGVDLEHAQAILVYGFLRPGQTVVYAGSNPIAEIHMRTNVRNKLGPNFRERFYEQALKMHQRSGVIIRDGKQTNPALSLNLRESGMDAIGLHNIRRAKALLHQKSV